MDSSEYVTIRHIALYGKYVDTGRSYQEIKVHSRILQLSEVLRKRMCRRDESTITTVVIRDHTPSEYIQRMCDIINTVETDPEVTYTRAVSSLDIESAAQICYLAVRLELLELSSALYTALCTIRSRDATSFDTTIRTLPVSGSTHAVFEPSRLGGHTKVRG